MIESVELKRFGKAFCLCIKADPEEQEPLFIQAESNDELSAWRDSIVKSINAAAGVGEGISPDEQRRKSAGVVMSAASADGEAGVSSGVPSASDPPSWLRTGMLQRALKEVSVLYCIVLYPSSDAVACDAAVMLCSKIS